MPTEVGQTPMAVFKIWTDKAWQRMHAWSDRPVSRAGKEALFKSIIQVILNHVMSCFQFPIATCE